MSIYDIAGQGERTLPDLSIIGRFIGRNTWQTSNTFPRGLLRKGKPSHSTNVSMLKETGQDHTKGDSPYTKRTGTRTKTGTTSRRRMGPIGTMVSVQSVKTDQSDESNTSGSLSFWARCRHIDTGAYPNEQRREQGC
jgi:hypothetical protein